MRSLTYALYCTGTFKRLWALRSEYEEEGTAALTRFL